jgi:hypothetical protein
MKYIILKEKVEEVFFKCPKIAAKSASPILFALTLAQGTIMLESIQIRWFS